MFPVSKVGADVRGMCAPRKIHMSQSFLSGKNIPIRERLIFALDVPTAADARRLVGLLGPSVEFYKIGLELFMAGGYFELLDWLTEKGKRVFVDLKFFDVPQTVGSAVRRLNGRGASFCTVHGNQTILQAACEAKDDVRVLAVTVLTSLDEGDLADLGFQCSPKELVLSRARRAIEAGCDGVVSSGLEARELRAELGARFLVITLASGGGRTWTTRNARLTSSRRFKTEPTTSSSAVLSRTPRIREKPRGDSADDRWGVWFLASFGRRIRMAHSRLETLIFGPATASPSQRIGKKDRRRLPLESRRRRSALDRGFEAEPSFSWRI